MSEDIHKVLKQHWGFDKFRPLQEDIINSAIKGNDTLALLPTGGGKSLCFQVPIMAQEGIGIVISPLIALMLDQVQTLKKIGIPAIALTSTLSFREIDTGLENCVYGKYKFLYMSPERLMTDIVQERLKRMKVSLLVVDEAHCISQWGYDFRPPYLKILETRDLLKGIPVLALTATATPKVVIDIQEKLGFHAPHVIQQSFYRSNLFYNVNHTEKKWSKTLEILHKIAGSAILYLRNRKQTVQVANWLQQSGVSATYYHAGLKAEERDNRQEKWVKNQIRVIVCTNAFGMGIDKPDVKLVLHLDLPESLEAYFQEAGRAGRNGNTAYSVVLVGPSDIAELKRKNLDTFPDIGFVKRVYQCLANFFQLASGGSQGQSFAFDFGAFIKQYDLQALKTYATLKILEKEGFILLNEGFKYPSRVFIKLDRTSLYDYQLRNPKLDGFIKTLIRSYGGLDIEYGIINESVLAQRLNQPEALIRKTLNHLTKQGIIDYVPSKGDSEIVFTQDRISINNLRISDANLKERYADRVRRIKAVEDYLVEDKLCRSRKLLDYFGEKSELQCGHCDVCRAASRVKSHDQDLENVIALLRQTMSAESTTLENLKNQIKYRESLLTEGLRWLLDAGEIELEGLNFRKTNSKS